MFEDSAALIGLLIAFLGIYLAHRLNIPCTGWGGVHSDWVGSGGVCFLLARETKGLLLGETADPCTAKYFKIAQDDEGVLSVTALTEQMGAKQVLASLSVEFEDHLTTDEIEACVNRIELKIKQKHPEIGTLCEAAIKKVWLERMQGRLE